MISDKHLVWMDLEMTGLEPRRDRIIEMAVIITDSDLNTVAEAPVMAIHQPDEILDAMDDWCTQHHTASGLVARVRASDYDDARAEREMLAFISQYVSKNQSPLCGNTICQDRRFLAAYMPELEDYFHYRNLDVTTLKILAQRWAPQVISGVAKESTHLALDDVRESIEELRHYRTQWLKC